MVGDIDGDEVRSVNRQISLSFDDKMLSQYRRYFISVILSISGIGFFLYTQGWFVLSLSGSNLSLGMAWSIFFTPSLIFLPLFGKLLNSKYAKITIVLSEFTKALLMFLFIPLIMICPRVTLVYLLAALMGILFSIFMPSLFVIVKNLFSSLSGTKYSHLLEVSIQIGSAVSILLAGYIYSISNFYFDLVVGGIVSLISAILLLKIELKITGDLGDINLIKHYWKYLTLIKSIFFMKDQKRRNYIFGIFHQFPQNIILVFNIPLIVYVDKNMGKGAFQYGIIDSSIGFISIFCGLLWARYANFSIRKALMLIMPILSAIVFLIIFLITPSSGIVYLIFPILGFFLTSSKIQCRATVLNETPAHQMGELTAFYQATTYVILVIMSFVISYLLSIVKAEIVFLILGLLMLIFAFLIKIFHRAYANE